MVGRVEGKVAIVSGAGSSGPGVGVGKAVSVLFAREGARVVLVDKFEDRALETFAMVKDEGGTATVVVADVSDPAQCERITDEAVAQFGRIDILVNNAAISPLVGMLDTDAKLYEQIMAVNTTGPFMLSKAAIPVMIEGGGGAVANITSIAAIRGTGVPETAYAASKAALLGIMASVACAYGPKGIRINCIAPGHIDTPMRNLAGAEIGIDVKAIDFTSRNALGREGDAWDIARAALFLCSDDAAYITGVHLPVDGGAAARAPG
jgi:NAD(P)-dependent dehydrogenase (short-subunit alcohol dehydrogenase family)